MFRRGLQALDASGRAASSQLENDSLFADGAIRLSPSEETSPTPQEEVKIIIHIYRPTAEEAENTNVYEEGSSPPVMWSAELTVKQGQTVSETVAALAVRIRFQHCHSHHRPVDRIPHTPPVPRHCLQPSRRACSLGQMSDPRGVGGLSMMVRLSTRRTSCPSPCASSKHPRRSSW